MEKKLIKKIYNKVPITIEQQINLLNKKGLLIDNKQTAYAFLHHVSYYRLRAYTYPFQDNENNLLHIFKRNDINFSDIIALYHFDKNLRELLFSAISTIEVSLRTTITQFYSVEFNDSHWFTNSNHYYNNYTSIIETIKSEVNRSHEEFINHYFSKYTLPVIPPSWMTLETVSFGTLSRLLKDLQESSIKKKIAFFYGLPNTDILCNWIHSIAMLRNHCAHHSRIWNRRLAIQIKIPRNTTYSFISANHSKHIKRNKIYGVIIAINYLLNIIMPKNDFINSVKTLINKKNKLVNLKDIGFPNNWENEDIWK